jgi:hypothetical protein
LHILIQQPKHGICRNAWLDLTDYEKSEASFCHYCHKDLLKNKDIRIPN